MNGIKISYLVGLLLFLPFIGVHSGMAAVVVQCPGDTNGDAIPENPIPGVQCKSIAGSDGFSTMADGRVLWIMSFIEVTGVPPGQVMDVGTLAGKSPAPLITAREGDDFYLSLTVRPMVMRPDLFDQHTVHWHGFPNAASIFDGEPMASLVPNQGSSITYYYRVPESGTYMYHCHVEASEHMQMGMLGNLYVTSAQDGFPAGTVLGTHTHQPDPDGNGPQAGDRYAYSDGDGSTRYDKDYPFQIISFDPVFHDANLNIQPLGFAAMRDTYPLINGRGYPDTINPSTTLGASPENNNNPSQLTPTLMTATQGQKILLRMSSLATVRFYTVTSPSIPMKVVGKDTKLLRSVTGANLYYDTHSITLGGGQTADVILDTQNIPPGTYFIYTSNLEELSNNQDDFGGMMTEIVIQ
jgi:FtsP/CotA-like multicopper oxidase with cupredoxin domain